jgi:hypothetical protein
MITFQCTSNLSNWNGVFTVLGIPTDEGSRTLTIYQSGGLVIFFVVVDPAR